MYPPQPDSRREVPDRTDLVRYRTVAHSVVLRDNGAIAILVGHKVTADDLAKLPRAIDKPGADGRRVFD